MKEVLLWKRAVIGSKPLLVQHVAEGRNQLKATALAVVALTSILPQKGEERSNVAARSKSWPPMKN